MKYMVFCMSLVMATVSSFSGPNDSNWIQLLRKGDTKLSDWTPKIQGHVVGDNPYNSFSYAEMADGSPRLLVTDTVTYNSGSYGYGHLFYKTLYSDYLLRAQYHFPTKQSFASASGTWTIQNNGLMLHCQSPSSMSQGQDYPQSFEDQLLGYWSTGGGSPPNTTTSNLCLVNTSANVNGKWYSDATGNHCTQSKFHSLQYDSSTTSVKGANSTNATWAGKDIWEYSMARVIDSTTITFWVRSRADTVWDSVFTFKSPRYGQTNTTSGPGSTTAVGSGYISIQMEGTTTEFAKIELLNLVGCMTKTDTAYRAFFVKNDPAQCSGITGIVDSEKRSRGIFSLVSNRIVASGEILSVNAYDLRGMHVASFSGGGRTYLDLAALKPGLYNLQVQTRQGSAQAVYLKL